ncbi:unnamed protein product [Symbiodinium natans]|uniref:Heterokaryon incompatibility domain-containing protein n=1 Tax=Symbiodinium natans TaxID=878477 RepID=A0A812JSI4_9DINO|nr:unnamed protein product [Symbiodinium natans]
MGIRSRRLDAEALASLLKVEDFLALGELICHEDAREARRLRCIDVADEAARMCQEEGVAFLSHQWASFEHPDPDGVQYRAMVKAVEEVLERGIKCSWIWVDYCSIPQRNTFQQQTAINSLSVYASYCSVFLSVVPPCIHSDTGHDIDINSYCSRAWCRLEKLSYGTAGWNADGRLAFMCTQEGITNDWKAIFDDESVLDVAGGAFSCCARNHPDGKPCDKQKIVGVLLGIYWRLLATVRDAPENADRATALLKLIDQDEKRYFPPYTSYISETGSTRIELFDGFLPVLRDMFLQDTEADHHQRVVVPGVGDPQLDDFLPQARARVKVNMTSL